MSPNIVCMRLDSERIAELVKVEFEELVKDSDKKPKFVEIKDKTKLCIDAEFLDLLSLAREEVLERE